MKNHVLIDYKILSRPELETFRSHVLKSIEEPSR